MAFIQQLQSILGIRQKRKEQDQQPLESPAKRSRPEPQVQDKLDPKYLNNQQPAPANGPQQAVAPALPQQLQVPVLQQQPMQAMQQPVQLKPAGKMFQRGVVQHSNAFKQLEDNRRSSGTPLGDAALHRRQRHFSNQGLHILQPQLGSSTPLVGWRSNNTPRHGLHSHLRLQGIADSKRYQEQQQSHQRQHHRSVKPAAGSAAVAVFGELAMGSALTPDPKQRLFDAPDTAAGTKNAPTAALGYATADREAVGRTSGLHPQGRFAQLMMRTAPGIGVVMNGPVSSMPGSIPHADSLAPMLISPAAAVVVTVPGAGVGAPQISNSPSAGLAFATVSAFQSQDTSQHEQEIAQLQQKFARLRENEQSFHREVDVLQNHNNKALALSPDYQTSTDPASKLAMRALLQQGQQQQRWRLQREADLVQQRVLHSTPAAISPEQQLAGRTEAAAAAALHTGKQRLPATAAVDDDDDVICFTSDDEDDEQQQQEDDNDSVVDGEQGTDSGEYEDEAEEGSEEESIENSAAEAATFAVGGLHLQDVWMGQRSDWMPTEHQLARFESATGGPGPLAELLTSHQRACIQLTREHLGCLRHSQWLNDEVINMYMAMLQDRDTALRGMPGVGAPRCHFFSTFFLNKLYKDAGQYTYTNVKRWSTPKKLERAGQKSSCLLDVDRIIVPVHQSAHWTAAMVDLAGKRFVFFDSLGGKNRWALEALRRWLADEAMDKRQEVLDTASWPALYPQGIPSQHNGCDCGVFALLFCNRLGLRQPFDFVQEDLLINARVRVCCELLDGCLPVPGKQHHHH